jgi:hypothetical protein
MGRQPMAFLLVQAPIGPSIQRVVPSNGKDNPFEDTADD